MAVLSEGWGAGPWWMSAGLSSLSRSRVGRRDKAVAPQ